MSLETSCQLPAPGLRVQTCLSQHGMGGDLEATVAASIAPCSAARNAVAGAAVPGERAPVGASRGSPSGHNAWNEGVTVVLDDAVQFAGQDLGLHVVQFKVHGPNIG